MFTGSRSKGAQGRAGFAPLNHEAHEVNWNTDPGRTYVVERATRLASDDFTAVSEELTGVGLALIWSTPLLAGVPQAFYRIVGSPAGFSR
jgi:hypothetical protein